MGRFGKPLCNGGFRRHRGGFAPAWGAEVVSSNIVGYEKISLSAGYNMVGVQFAEVGGDTKILSTVGELDSTMDGVDEDGDYATTMRVWTGNGYKTYGWSGTGMSEFFDDASLDNKWLNNDMEEDDTDMTASSGFWVNAATAGTMIISGEVPSTATVSVQLTAGYNIIANPYPGAVKVADFGILESKFAGVNEDGDYATTLRIWTGNGYKTYGWSGTGMSEFFDDASLDNKWLNNDMETDTETIPFGTAVWINAEQAGTITFSLPSAD